MTNKSDKKSQDINPLWAIGIVGVSVLLMGVYLFSDDIFTTNTPTSPQVAGVTQVVTNVLPPELEGAPTLLPLKITDMEIFGDYLSSKKRQASMSIEDAKIAEAQLKTAQAMALLADINSLNMNGEDFGFNQGLPPISTDGQIIPMSSNPKRITIKREPDVKDSEITEYNPFDNMTLLSISKMNESIEAIVNINGSVVAMNKNGISSGNSIDGLIVRKLDENAICMTIKAKARCLELM